MFKNFPVYITMCNGDMNHH